MTKRRWITVCFALAFCGMHQMGQAQVQPYDIPSDMTALPYNVQEMVELIQEAYEAPVQTNAYVQLVEEYPGFPNLTLGNALTNGKKKKLAEWVETHPDAIEALLIARKKNYDTYFNPATTGSSNQ